MLLGREDLVFTLFGRQVPVVAVTGVEVVDTIEHEQPVGDAADELLQGVGASGPAGAVGEQGITSEKVRTEGEAGRAGRVSGGEDSPESQRSRGYLVRVVNDDLWSVRQPIAASSAPMPTGAPMAEVTSSRPSMWSQ